VLDVGCAFGFGTAVLADHHRGSRWVAGLEPDSAFVRAARRRYAWLPLAQADAAAVPIGSEIVDAVVLLDVLEHVTDPAAVRAEAHRVLRPCGQLLVSVPHAGPLAGLDSLNRYAALRRRLPWLPPLERGELSAGGTHRHFSRGELAALLGPGFDVVRVRRTGLGLAELLHVVVLLLCRALLRSERAYFALRYLYYTAYLAEDLLPTGPAGYHLMLEARATPVAGAGGARPERPDAPAC
jgi:SAM-dependent methyltransferase